MTLRRRIAAASLGMVLAVPAASASVQPFPLWNATLPGGSSMDGPPFAASVTMLPEGSLLAALLQGPWREYARDRLVPELDVRVDLEPLPDDDERARRQAFLPGFARSWLEEHPQHRFRFGVERSRVPESPLLPRSLNEFRLDRGGLGLEQTLFSPTYSFQINERSQVGVSAVLAYQEFSTFGFGHLQAENLSYMNYMDYMDYMDYRLQGRESALGTGVRLGMSSEVLPGLSVGAAYQSRIAMDPFRRYQNLYAEPGEFDIPASANVGLAVDATGQSTLSFDVRHIGYSDIKPFTSRVLPNRFLALLGDGTSPNFAWKDLTVYQVGWSWENEDEDLAWNLSWSTRRQPAPTSEVLASALRPQFSNEHWQVGLIRRTSDQSRVSLSASYTPSDYFLSLDGRGFEASDTLDRVEVEARWAVDF